MGDPIPDKEAPIYKCNAVDADEAFSSLLWRGSDLSYSQTREMYRSVIAWETYHGRTPLWIGPIWTAQCIVLGVNVWGDGPELVDTEELLERFIREQPFRSWRNEGVVRLVSEFRAPIQQAKAREEASMGK